jgi:hypothetical protein
MPRGEQPAGGPPTAGLSVILPALNEAGGMAGLVQRVLAQQPALCRVGVPGLEVIVVDDGSPDQTAFDPPLDRHFGWLGLTIGGIGTILAAASLGLGTTEGKLAGCGCSCWGTQQDLQGGDQSSQAVGGAADNGRRK